MCEREKERESVCERESGDLAGRGVRAGRADEVGVRDSGPHRLVVGHVDHLVQGYLAHKKPPTPLGPL